MKRTFLIAAALVSLCLSPVFGDVKLPKTFTDNAVFQRDTTVKVWGWADAGEKVTVTFNGQTAETTACEAGKWFVELKPMKALCEGTDLVVAGKNTITLKNIVVGEVWVCSGQSNMEMPLNSWGQPRLACTDEEISGDYSFIRFNRAHHVQSAKPLDDVACSGWQLCKDGVQKSCTAAGFHFANRLHKELGCPIGLIDSNWGGSNINSWMPDETWFLLPELEAQGKQIKAAREANQPNPCGGMYYAMLAPWSQYAIRGAIWYQGCTNAGEGEFYYFKQKAMIQQWRTIWGYEFPFYWVQLANFQGTNDDPNQAVSWAHIRDGQTRCMDVPKTGQAVIIDIGEAHDIHPRNKFDVGNRLAAWALTKDYGIATPYASPLFKSVTFDGAKAIVKFDNVGAGLVVGKQDPRQFSVVNDTLKRFAVAGEDKVFYWGEAKIVDKDTVEITCPKVANPVAVRYAYQINPDGCNLYNAEGLPATPFRTDKW